MYAKFEREILINNEVIPEEYFNFFFSSVLYKKGFITFSRDTIFCNLVKVISVQKVIGPIFGTS